MSISRLQNDTENERRWKDEAELRRLRLIEQEARAVGEAIGRLVDRNSMDSALETLLRILASRLLDERRTNAE